MGEPARKLEVNFNRLADWSLFFFHDHLEVTSPEYHGEIYDLYQTGSNRVAVMAFRGSAKSSCNRCYILETIYEGARVAKRIGLLTSHVRKVMYLSSTYDIAVESLEWIKEQIEINEDLNSYYPGFKILRWNESRLLIERPDKSRIDVRVRGKGAKVRGFRPDILIGDDLEDDESVQSSDQREKDLKWLNSAVINTLKHWQQLIITGSNLHPQSLMWNVMQRQGWKKLDIQLLNEKNESIWPEFWPMEKIDERIQDIGRQAFNAEFMNRPEPFGATIFSREWFKHYEPDSEAFKDLLSKGLHTIISIDPAISKKETADYTAICAISSTFDKDPDHYLRRDGMIRGHWTINQQVNEAVRLYDKFKASEIRIETVAYQEALAQEIRRFCDDNRRHINIIEHKPDKDKERRAHKVAPTIERGKVFYDPTDRGHVSFIDEAVLFPTGDRDDQVDAFDDCLQAQIEWGGRSSGKPIKSAIPENSW